MIPTFDDVLRAREALRGRVIETPVLRVPALDAIAGAELYLKCENLQRIGAFKARGALNCVLGMPEAQRARGLVTYSSGNHGQAVALAARELGLEARVFMPEDAPKVKVDAILALGAAVVFAGATSADRQREALAFAESSGAAVVPPFDDAAIIAGQGTATLELLEAADELGVTLDRVLIPVGGGGLLAGACLAAEGHGKGTRIVAVEPEAANAFQVSLDRGERTAVEPGATIADGLRPVETGGLNFEIAKSRVVNAIAVDDDAIGRAVVRLLLDAKVLVEPSGAAACAAALERRVPGAPRRMGIMLSGGNVAPARIAELLKKWA